MTENLLCFGDNADFLRDAALFSDESVDLIYLDPPFNSQRPYNILFKDHGGTPSAAQINAFDDTWTWDETAQRNYEFIVTQAGFASGPHRTPLTKTQTQELPTPRCPAPRMQEAIMIRLSSRHSRGERACGLGAGEAVHGRQKWRGERYYA